MGSQPISPNSNPGPGNLNCMICLSTFFEDKNFNRNAEIVEILADIFKVISIYMKWDPPSKFQYTFGTEVFPFCKECRILAAKLYKFDSLLLEIQKEIDTLALQMSAKILQSQYDMQPTTEVLISTEINSTKNVTDILSGSEKLGYYRNSICRRYFPSVRLISDPTLKVPERGVDDQDDSCQSDSNECQTSHNFQDDAQDAENISMKDDDGGNHEETTVECLNLVPFPSLRDRVKIVGKCQFLLDDKCLFECSETRIKCISCNILFRKKTRLKAHLKDCPGSPSDDVTDTIKYRGLLLYDKLRRGEFRCRRCKYLCSSPNAMCLHMRTFHKRRTTLKEKIKPFYIELEPNKFVCNQNYPFELKDEKFICGTCLSDFSTRSKVLSHIRREHIWTNVYKMIVYENISPDKFVWTDPFNQKHSYERVGNRYKCDQCSHSTLTDKSMREHVRDVHIQGNSVCKICGKVCNSKHNLSRHLKRHTDDRPFTCEFCGKSLKCLGNLKIHKATAHLDIFDKKFKCEVCGKLFGTSTLLTSHSKRHVNSVCHVCGKNVRMLRLNDHMLSHSEENTFECKKCDKKFRHYTSLHIHLKNHDGTKPYECDICGMKFTQNYSVTRHKNVVHNSKKTTKTYAKLRKRKRQEDLSSEEDEEFEESSDSE